jgi:uncharacterized membrane protein (DUF2068 family)
MKRGLKAVAVFEAAKGLLVFFLSLSLYTFIHRDFQGIIDEYHRRWHIDFSGHLPGIVELLLRDMTDVRFHFLLFFASSYMLMRFVEAYGLWFGKRWAEWFALLSGGIYLPVEIYELAKGFSWMKMGVLAANLLIVLYIALVLMRGRDWLIAEV